MSFICGLVVDLKNDNNNFLTWRHRLLGRDERLPQQVQRNFSRLVRSPSTGLVFSIKNALPNPEPVSPFPFLLDRIYCLNEKIATRAIPRNSDRSCGLLGPSGPSKSFRVVSVALLRKYQLHKQTWTLFERHAHRHALPEARRRLTMPYLLPCMVKQWRRTCRHWALHLWINFKTMERVCSDWKVSVWVGRVFAQKTKESVECLRIACRDFNWSN